MIHVKVCYYYNMDTNKIFLLVCKYTYCMDEFDEKTAGSIFITFQGDYEQKRSWSRVCLWTVVIK